MRIEVVILINLMFMTLTAWAGETLPALKAGSEIYSNVTVVALTPTDVLFTSASRRR